MNDHVWLTIGTGLLVASILAPMIAATPLMIWSRDNRSVLQRFGDVGVLATPFFHIFFIPAILALGVAAHRLVLFAPACAVVFALGLITVFRSSYRSAFQRVREAGACA